MFADLKMDSEIILYKPTGWDKLHAPLEARGQMDVTDCSGQPGFKRTLIDLNSTLLIYMNGLKIISSPTISQSPVIITSVAESWASSVEQQRSISL